MNLDIRTLFAVLAGAMIIQGASLALAWRVHRETVPALGYWSLSAWMAAGGTFLIALRGLVPPFYSFVVANMMGVAAYTVLWNGARAFAGRGSSWLPGAGVILLVGAGIGYYTFVEASFGTRVAVVCIPIAAFSILAGVELLRAGFRAKLATAWLNGGVLLLHGLTNVGRVLLALFGEQTDDLLTAHSAHSVIMLEAVLLAIAWNVGVYAMTGECIQRDLNRKATHDSMTGILNRRAFLDQAEREIRRAERTGEPLSFLMIDIDRFKSVNDTHGHAAGDRVIQDITALLASHLRAFDLLGRYGGEEFCILLSNAPVSTAAMVAERLRTAVERMAIPHRGATLRTTISVGIAEMPAGERNLERTLARADAALYAAKVAGRNRVAADPRGGVAEPASEPAV